MSGKAPAAPDRARIRDSERAAARAVLAGLDDAAGLRALASALQAALGYVPPPAVPLLAAKAGVERTSVFELVQADAHLSFAPPGRHRVAICQGENCSKRGAAALGAEAKRLLGVDFFRHTPDLAIRLEPFYCFGRCRDGPNVLIDGELHGAMTPATLAALLHDLLEHG